MSGGLLENRRGAVFGVVNDKSIAWACAQALLAEGASLVMNYFGDAQEKRVRKLVADYPDVPVYPCDVTQDDEIEAFFKSAADHGDALDFVIHSVAYADRGDLTGRFTDTSRANFAMTLDVSAYSLVAITRAAEPYFKNGGSVVAMSYYGAEKVLPKYNVMGVAKSALESSARYLASELGEHNIRVNCISAGPVRTLSASAIPGFRDMLTAMRDAAPMKRNIEAVEVGRTAVYLCSDLSSAVTGEVIHVDCGYNILGAYGELAAHRGGKE